MAERASFDATARSECDDPLLRGPPGVPGPPLILGRLPGLPGGEPPNTSVRYSHVAHRAISPEQTETKMRALKRTVRPTDLDTKTRHRTIAGQLTSRWWVGGPWVGVSDPGRAPK